jgi:hypothetical protein
MGGSGGGGGGGWAPSSPTSPCDSLKFLAVVSSPQPNALAGLRVGILLDISVQSTPRSAVIVTHGRTVVGALTGPKVSTLVNCIQNGYEFKAKVMSLSSGRCEVEVRPA